ncbi:MAG TPA: helix-turn-helix domain-containing protein, partial [Pseudonocardia sp.]|nr:helix-turn-helix domain-containing protein [Pseudonocardia sp.]
RAARSTVWLVTRLSAPATMMETMSAAASSAQPGDEHPEPPDQLWPAPVNALGEFIRAQRRLARLSLRELAAMTRVSNAYLSQVERGMHQPSLKVLLAIANALQLSTEQLLVQAGWTGRRPAAVPPTAGGTEEAIRADPRLTPEQRTALIGVYRSFVGEDPDDRR